MSKWLEKNPGKTRKPRFRAAARRALREQGIKSTYRSWAWSVEPAALSFVPDWVLESQIPGLGEQPGRYWLIRQDALALKDLDRAAGGVSRITKIEIRYCEVCWRPLIAQDAERRRKMDQSGPQGRQMPCGPQCVEDGKRGTWKKLRAAA